MSELFLKQVLNQGSRQFDLYRRKCVDEKKKLFEQLDAKQKIRSAVKKEIKAAKKNKYKNIAKHAYREEWKNSEGQSF